MYALKITYSVIISRCKTLEQSCWCFISNRAVLVIPLLNLWLVYFLIGSTAICIAQFDVLGYDLVVYTVAWSSPVQICCSWLICCCFKWVLSCRCLFCDAAWFVIKVADWSVGGVPLHYIYTVIGGYWCWLIWLPVVDLLATCLKESLPVLVHILVLLLWVVCPILLIPGRGSNYIHMVEW